MNKGLQEYGLEATNFLKGIGAGGEARLLRDLKELSDHRHQINIRRPGSSKSFGGGLFELRTTHSKENLEYRCIYAFHENEIVILLCFTKKTRKTDPNHLEEARKRLNSLKQKKWKPNDTKLH